MSKRRRHYRGIGSLVKFPGLSGLKIPSSVKPVDVAVGMGLGLAGAIGVKKGLAAANISIPAAIPAPVLSGLATAALLYFAQKKSPKAAGHAVGAALGGAIVWAYGMLAAPGMPLSSYGDIRTLPPGYGGPIFDNPRMSGFGGPIFDNPRMSGANNLARLAGLQGLGDDNDDGMFPAP